VEALVRGLDRERRRLEAAIATFVHRVGESGTYLVDKHRSPKAWGKAACNWSRGEAARFVRAGAVLDRFSSAAARASQGELGVAQLHALGRVVANPRVAEHLADGEQFLVGQADGFHVSNHGGRQLDRCVATADLVAPLRTAVGPTVPIVVDSGVHCGGDVAVALALGADMAFVGRAYVYAVAAAGERGVAHLLGMLAAELQSVMQLCGVTTLAQLRENGPALLGG